MNLIVRLIAGALVFLAASALSQGVVANSGPWSYLWATLTFSLINIFTGSLVKFQTLPASLPSLVLFPLAISTVSLILIVSWTNPLVVSNFSLTLIASVITLITVVSINKLNSEFCYK